jgi:aldose 1-epimerase
MIPVKQTALSVSGTLHSYLQNQPVYLVTIRNESITVIITNIGCSIMSVETPGKNGVAENIVAGFTDPVSYLHNDHYLGCVVGRYANRIGGGRFIVDGQSFQLPVNNGVNHLHGGMEGFHKKIWKIHSFIEQHHETGVLFEYLSPDGEEGYPGNVHVQVKYLLHQDNRLSIHYIATTDKKTPVNLTNHSYFNLTGFHDPLVTGHVLHILAEQYTEKSATDVPTGKLVALCHTPLDFSTPKPIGTHIDRFPADQGFDHNYVLQRHRQHEIVLAAELHEPATGRLLRIFTDQPAIQLYTANAWNGITGGQHDQPYRKHGAVALETQAFPDSPNHAHFPNTILCPGETYETTTIFEFSTK